MPTRTALALLLPAALLLADPTLAVDRTRHAFGEIPPTRPVHAFFKVVNTGDGVLEIRNLVPSCECTTATVDRSFVKAGEQALIDMVFDPAKDKGHLERSLMVVTNDPRSPRTILDYEADVVYPVMATEEAVFFPDSLPHDLTTREVRFRTTVPQDLDLVLKPTTLPPFLKVSVQGGRREAVVKVTLDGSKLPKTGGSNATLTFSTGVPALPEIPLEYFWYVGHAIEAQPEGLAFDPLMTGTLQSFPVKLVEIRQRPFRILALKSVSAPFQAEILTEGAAPEHGIRVSLGAAVPPGSYRGSVILRVEDPDQEEVEIKVTAHLQAPGSAPSEP